MKIPINKKFLLFDVDSFAAEAFYQYGGVHAGNDVITLAYSVGQAISSTYYRRSLIYQYLCTNIA
ncbi:hypothetical protein [Nostoc sp. MS1]|uniref:hypothetical protein n=1 Tax=Nostoc sp. MS1 TaxID=2764711 RepID=UPI001CC42127|nr:hypothetical protein [Nostoc sp. MS1]BCL38873.1 hypothetical protein NSMS1_53200 [Nostoc sp. MS1]